MTSMAANGVDFDTQPGGLGTHGIWTPVLAPKANAVAERMVRTLRWECLDHVIVLNEEQILTILSDFAAYYIRDRPLRSLGLGRPEVRDRCTSGVLRCHSLLGGLHHSYGLGGVTGPAFAPFRRPPRTNRAVLEVRHPPAVWPLAGRWGTPRRMTRCPVRVSPPHQ